MSPNLSAIAAEFEFDDIERDKKLGGDIAIAFFVVGVPASFVVGCLADVVDKRSLLFLWVILIGEGACFCTYFVSTYGQLYACRALTGCSVGGALPLIYSVLGDYYEPKERGWVSGAISMGCGVGISIGQGVAGSLGPRYGWRMPFLVVSVPAMICAVFVYIWVPEVERGAGEKRTLNNATMHRNDEGEENGVELTTRINNNEPGDTNDMNSCKMRRTIQATSRTTLVTAGDSPKQGLYIQLNNQDSPISSSCSTSTNTSYVLCGPLTRYYRESIHTHVQTLSTLLQCPSVLLGVFQGAPGCIPWGIVNTYLNDYLSSDRGLSVEGATLVILVFGVGNFIGTR
jgi:predicted MFS family arabinose efflux permease